MRLFASIFSIPGLDSYSDAEFEKLVWQAKVRRGDAIWVLPLLSAVVGGGLWLGIGYGMSMGMKLLGASPMGAGARQWWGVNIVVAIIVAIAVGAATRWLLIVRSIRIMVNKAGCPFCDFSLVGLRVDHGWVRCPECGQKVCLHEHRMIEDDLIPEEQKHKPLPGAGERGAYREWEGVGKRRAAGKAARRGS